MPRRSHLLAAVLLLGGCSLSIDPDELDPLASPEGYCQTLWGEYLDLAQACGVGHELAAAAYAQISAGCAAAGRAGVGYDRALAESCVARVRSASCTTDSQAIVDGCDEALVGTVPDGGACLDSIQCAGTESRCVDPSGGCGGACRAPGTTGDRCGPGYASCAVGYLCAGSPPACTPADEGTLCAVAGDGACGVGTYCDGTVCRRYAREGETCDVRRCDPDAGTFCDTSSAVLSARTCKRNLSLPAGAECTGPMQCSGATFCEMSTAPGRCVERRGEGSTCLGDDRCMPPLACLGDSLAGAPGTCGPRRDVGEPCSSSTFDCVLGAACDGGVCLAWPAALGERCASGFDRGCLAGRCLDPDATGVYTCAPYLQPGDACLFDVECGASLVTGSGARCAELADGRRVCVASCL